MRTDDDDTIHDDYLYQIESGDGENWEPMPWEDPTSNVDAIFRWFDELVEGRDRATVSIGSTDEKAVQDAVESLRIRKATQYRVVRTAIDWQPCSEQVRWETL